MSESASEESIGMYLKTCITGCLTISVSWVGTSYFNFGLFYTHARKSDVFYPAAYTHNLHNSNLDV